MSALKGPQNAKSKIIQDDDNDDKLSDTHDNRKWVDVSPINNLNLDQTDIEPTHGHKGSMTSDQLLNATFGSQHL